MKCSICGAEHNTAYAQCPSCTDWAVEQAEIIIEDNGWDQLPLSPFADVYWYDFAEVLLG